MFNGDYINFYKGLLNENTVNADSSTQADTIKVTSNNENTSLYVPLFKVGSNGYKSLLFDVNNQLYYNPSTSTLTAYNLTVSNSLNFPLGSIDGSRITNYSIALNKLMTSIYATLSTPNTLMFRDSTGSANIHDMTVDGILTAIADSTSTVSRANQLYVTGDSGNSNNPMVFFKVATDGYKGLIYDPQSHLTFNPNTNILNLNGGTLNLTNTSNAFIKSGSYSTDTPSLTLGDSTHQGIISLTNTSTMSSLIEANPTSGLEFWKSISGSTSLIATFDLSSTYMSGNVTIPTGRMYQINGVNLTTNNISEGSNLYYTDLRFDTRLATKTTNNLSEGTSNLYYTDLRFDTRLATKTTNNLSEGTSNLYYTDLRFDTRLASKTTNNLSEGTSNLYYTDARVNTYLTNTNPLSISSSAGGTNIYGSITSGSIAIKASDLTGSTQIYLDNSGTGISTTALPITIYNGAVKSVDLTTSGCNIATGLTYKINGTALRTSEISENTNLYYTDLRARSSITPTDTAEIDHTYSSATGVLTSDIKALSIANSKLTNSSITLGSTACALGSTTTTVAGLTSISIGDIVSIGTLQIKSKPASITYISNFKQTTLSTSIDSENTGTLDINTVSTGAQINVGSKINFAVNPTFTNRFYNIQKSSILVMAHTTTLQFGTDWMPIGNTSTTTPLQVSITAKSSNSYMRITVNVSLSNWGTVATNRHVSVGKATSAYAWATFYTTALVNGNYGIHHILSGLQYESMHFSYIDTLANTAGTTYYYCLLGRSNTANATGINLGNSSYAEITVEELV